MLTVASSAALTAMMAGAKKNADTVQMIAKALN